MARVSIVLFLYLVILVAIPVMVGIYVYRDAQKRGMNTVVWTLVAVLAPMLTGFIIYLIVRGSYSNLSCPECGMRVTERYVVCPQCGKRLKAACGSCGMAVEPEWKVCPHCAAQLLGQYENVAAPVQKKDRTLSVILLAVILVPFTLLLASVLCFSIYSTKQSGSASTLGCYEEEEYLAELKQAGGAHGEEIRQWLDSCDKDSGEAYALRYTTEENGEKVTEVLVYYARAGEELGMQLTTKNGFFKDMLQALYEVNPDSDYHGIVGYQLGAITYRSERYAEVEAFCGGEQLQCNVTEVDYPLCYWTE